jgi:dual specificity tyrosine-phosphorylation-regulated kinase 2/3/4
MWSYGCILFELYMGYPLFPGEDEKEHMAMMMEIKGVPPRSVLARATRRKVFFDDEYQPIITPNSKGKLRQPGGKNMADIMSCPDSDFVDFIDVRPLIHIYNRNVRNGKLMLDLTQSKPSLTLSSQKQSMN